MKRLELGKISYAEFGSTGDMCFLFGLQLMFKFPNGGVGDGGLHTVNMSETCDYGLAQSRAEECDKVMAFTYNLLKQAKVEKVSKLVGIPVEVEFDGNTFKSFRVLEEVL
jgi:hypothetical protein